MSIYFVPLIYFFFSFFLPIFFFGTVIQLLSKGVNNGTGDEAKVTITMEPHDEDVSWIIRQTIESIDQVMKSFSSSPIVTSTFVSDEKSKEEPFDVFFNDTVYECKKHPNTTEGFGSRAEKLLIPPVHSYYGTIDKKDGNAATVIKTHGLIENGYLTIYSTLSSKLTYEQESKLTQLTSRSATNDTETNIEPSDKANKGNNSSSSASASSSSSFTSIASSAAPARVWSNAVVSMLTDLFKDLIMRAMHNLLAKALDNLDDGGRVASLLRVSTSTWSLKVVFFTSHNQPQVISFTHCNTHPLTPKVIFFSSSSFSVKWIPFSVSSTKGLTQLDSACVSPVSFRVFDSTCLRQENLLTWKSLDRGCKEREREREREKLGVDTVCVT